MKKNKTNPQIVSADSNVSSPPLLVNVMLCLTVGFSVALPEKASLGTQQPSIIPRLHMLSKSLLTGSLAHWLERLTGKEEQIQM